jgi:TonB family protein
MPQPAAKRHTGGLFVVVLLGVIFFVLLALLIFSTKHETPHQAAEIETLTVLAPRIRLRTEPNPKAPVVATAVAGEKLLLVEDRGPWARVQDPDGLVGWAERSMLERTSERQRRLLRFAAIKKLPVLQGISNKRTTLYAGPGIFYPIVGDLSEQSDVKVYTRDHDFYAIDFNGEIAYADIDAIDVTATGTPQLDVKTSQTTTAPPPTETTASAAPAEAETAAPVEPEPEQPQPTVYAAVPPGGTQPEEIDRVVPRYPMAARAANIGGRVVIRGIVRKDGTIDNVEVIKDLPYGLGEAARQAVEQWKFRPATYRGEPIDVYYTVTVNFRLQ